MQEAKEIEDFETCKKLKGGIEKLSFLIESLDPTNPFAAPPEIPDPTAN